MEEYLQEEITTVIHAIKKIEDLMQKDKKFEVEVQEITIVLLKMIWIFSIDRDDNALVVNTYSGCS